MQRKLKRKVSMFYWYADIVWVDSISVWIEHVFLLWDLNPRLESVLGVELSVTTRSSNIHGLSVQLWSAQLHLAKAIDSVGKKCLVMLQNGVLFAAPGHSQHCKATFWFSSAVLEEGWGLKACFLLCLVRGIELQIAFFLMGRLFLPVLYIDTSC